jgi:hypothetical protein
LSSSLFYIQSSWRYRCCCWGCRYRERPRSNVTRDERKRTVQVYEVSTYLFYHWVRLAFIIFGSYKRRCKRNNVPLLLTTT